MAVTMDMSQCVWLGELSPPLRGLKWPRRAVCKLILFYAVTRTPEGRSVIPPFRRTQDFPKVT